MAVIVKICGMTNVEDALAAAEFGADAIGFIFHEPSPRSVSLETAARICQAVPPHVVKVGVFVDAPENLVLRAIAGCSLNLVQFHGNESPEYCVQFAVMNMKAFRIRDAASLQQLAEYPTDAWLLDSYVADKLGGTGETFNWALAREATSMGKPVFLAGGLTPVNVAEAIRTVGPYGVDVSSGVEARPGKKDVDKLKAFISAAKQAAP